MPYSFENTKGSQVLKLEGAVTIRDAQELAALLGKRMEESKPVTVNAVALEDLDTCILQLLCSLRASVPAISFEFSEDFSKAVDRCGLRRELFSTRGDL